MYFVCGIHGAGKTTYCRQNSSKNGIPYFSASELISRHMEIKQQGTKCIDKIDDRQMVLISEVQELNQKYDNYFLDGHLCLINNNGRVERISSSVFKSLGIDELWVVIANEKEIHQRLSKRDGIEWDLDFINYFQEEEIRYAYEIAQELNIKVNVINTSNKCNIVLPIKPVFAEKILSGEKKYEYRKRIAQKDIDKIYIYATTPIRRIVGEVEVVSVLSMNKEKLWKTTANKAGITQEDFMEYFRNCDYANAYELGEVKKYDTDIRLEDWDIHYVPQSYIYINEI